MRIINRAQFLALPAGTLFSKYEPCVFGELSIKDDNRGTNDWWEVTLAGAISASSSDDFCDRCHAAEHGESIEMDFDTVTADGLYDEHQLFAVLEPKDVAALIARLQSTMVV